MTLAECTFLAIWEVLKFMFQPQFVIPAVILGGLAGILQYSIGKKELEDGRQTDGRSVQESN